MKTKKELEEELVFLEKEEKRLNVQDIVFAKRKELIKRRYSGLTYILKMFKSKK